jgi:hypothetical protein
LNDDAVDISRTITNDILEFHEVFGIEATRELLYKELFKVYAEKHPNPRHIQMLADIMTYRGKLMQIDRHGLNKNSEIGPIAKASFEEVMNIFTKAALFAEKDNMKGVSANILAGQFCKSGTNAFEILMDEDKLMEEINIPNYNKKDFVDVDEKDVDVAFANTYNSVEKDEVIEDADFSFGFGIEKSKEFVLGKTVDNNVVISDKVNNIIDEAEDEFDSVDAEDVPEYNNNFNINVEEVPSYNGEDVEVNNNIGVNFNSVEVEEVPVVKTKKVRVKKVVEEKPKKVRVSRKKKADEEK